VVETIDAILRDLELPALRARYAYVKQRDAENFPYFYTEPYEFAVSKEEQAKQGPLARQLNRSRPILMRAIELAADGLRPEVVSYGEPGNSHLILIVRFGERGRRILEGSGLARSEAVRVARKSLWIGYYAIAVLILLVVFWDRIGRIGWWQTLAGLSLVVALMVFTRKFWR